MLIFQEQFIKQQLDSLSSRSRVAFAASCAQRLAGAYRQFVAKCVQAGRADFFDETLNYLWTHIQIPPEKATTARRLADVMATIPDEDDPGWTPLTPYGDDALSALAYCLRCLQSGDPQDATWAARRVYEALDYFVNSRDHIEPNEPGAQTRVLRDPMIQAELERQARDIADLTSAGEFPSQELIDKLRQRSVAEQAIMIA